jgi:hypothetical protein
MSIVHQIRLFLIVFRRACERRVLSCEASPPSLLKRRQDARLRVRINYTNYGDMVMINCVADDARTVVASRKPISSLETLYRLVNYVGGDPKRRREEIEDLGHGGCWADVKPEHFGLLGIKKTTNTKNFG